MPLYFIALVFLIGVVVITLGLLVLISALFSAVWETKIQQGILAFFGVLAVSIGLVVVALSVLWLVWK